jgi:GT2 family glycosyltransferase/tetratricopeptide (TPR) repeat protein
MKVAYVTEYTDWLHNRMFDESASCNVNNVLDRYIALKEYLHSNDIELNTFDMYRSTKDVDIWLMQEPTPGILRFIIDKDIQPSRVIYFLHEPPVYNYWGWDYIRKSHYLYDAVLTWETSAVNANPKFFHYHFPVKFDPAKREHYLGRKKKNLCIIMHSNKMSSVPGELYSFRRNVITYFEKRGDRLLDLYGYGWNNDKVPDPFFTDLYRGTTPDKRDTYAEYYFSICIDNCISPGYITYDPLISMITGTVPVYVPMPDSAQYIPPDTYIDMSQFGSLDELAEHLLSIRDSGEYEKIRKRGWDFVTSQDYYPFTVEKFARDVRAAIDSVAQKIASGTALNVRLVKPEEARLSMNPHFANILPMDLGITSAAIDPAKMCNFKRFDIPAKHIYVKHREMKVGSDFARRLYAEHIKAFNGFHEPDGSGKTGEKAFIESFDTTIDSIREKGFDESQSMLPVTQGGDLVEGSHRLAACIYYGKKVGVLGFSFDTWAYPWNFFLDRGLAREYCDAIASEHITLKDNTYLALLFPSAVGRDDEARKVLEKYCSIFYEKSVRLVNDGPVILMNQIYKHENWLGNAANNYAGARLKAGECFRSDLPVRVFLIETDDPARLKQAKDEVRALYNIANHSIHINDTREETVRVGRLLLNDNGVHFLNHASLQDLPLFATHYRTLHDTIAEWDERDREGICVTGSAVMALYGIRDARDIDYFHFEKELPEERSGILGSHNKEIVHYTRTRDEIIFDPSHHFYYDGVKFAGLDIIRQMKAKRQEPKDVQDVALIDAFLERRSVSRTVHERPSCPDISIIILNYNGYDDIRPCIDSITRNTPQPYEIIVFDNASTDNSVEYLKGLPGIVLVESPVNLGCPAGRAEAMTYVHPDSKYVIFLDNDAVVTHGWTTRFLDHVKADPRIGMMGPRSNYVSGTQLVQGASYRTIEELESFAADWSRKMSGKRQATHRLVGFCMFITRDVVDKIGSIDASFGKFGFEDDDYTWRTIVAGFEAMIADDVFIHHKGGPQGQGNTVYNEALIDAWNTFKAKWSIPASVEYGAPFNISPCLLQPFDEKRHHVPLVLKRGDEPEVAGAFARANEAAGSGDIGSAIAIFRKLLERRPDSGIVLAGLGTLLEGKGDYPAARDCLIKALAAMPEETDIAVQLASLLERMNEPDEALATFEAALQKEPAHAGALGGLLNILVQTGRFSDAVERVKGLLLQDPGNAALIYVFGKLAVIRGSTAAVRTCIEKLKQVDPFHPGIDELSGALQAEPGTGAPAPMDDGVGESPIPLSFVKLKDYSLDPGFLRKLRDIFDTDVFVETGTFMGSTAAAASSIFREIHTIELDTELFRRTAERLEKTGNIHAYQGDSATVLPGILAGVKGKVLLWLDGHYSGQGTARSQKDTPVIEELNAIIRSGLVDPVIMIDDIRLFPSRATGALPGDYPPLGEVCSLINTADPGYRFAVYGDTLVAYKGHEALFSPAVTGCTVSRLSDDIDLDEAQVFEAEDMIRGAEGAEISAISAYRSVFASDNATSGYFRLWHALLSMGRSEYPEAIEEIKATIECGFRHWRLYVYLAESYLQTGQTELARQSILQALKENPSSLYAQKLLGLIPSGTGTEAGNDPASERFRKDAEEYTRLLGSTGKRFAIDPDSVWCLDERTPTLSFDPHYILHTSWAARILAATRPERHVDISSSLYFSSIASAFVPIEFYDYRPAPVTLPGFSSHGGDATRLPFADNSVSSLSCMHVVEHIGLGRYGDPIDPDGDLKAIEELKRVVSPSGQLLFVVPIGKPKLVFNAHRIYSYDQIVRYFEGFYISEFSLIPDTMAEGSWSLVEGSKELSDRQSYGCGCFRLTKSNGATGNYTADPSHDEIRAASVSDKQPPANVKPSNRDDVDTERRTAGETTSFVIPAAALDDNLRLCLESVDKNTKMVSEIIVITKSTSVIPVWLKKISKAGHTKIIKKISNPGFSQMLNQGLREVRGEFIVILDPGTIIFENTLETMVRSLKHDNHWGIVVPMSNHADGPQQIPQTRDLTLSDFRAFLKTFSKRNQHRFAEIYEVGAFCAVFNKALADRIGPFDEDIESPVSVMNDYRLRALLEGYGSVVAADTAVFRHSAGSVNTGSNIIFHKKWNSFNPYSDTGKKLIPFVTARNARELRDKTLIDESVQSLLEGIKYTPEERSIYYCLAEILTDSKRYPESIEALESLPHDEKSSPRAWEAFGYCHYYLDNIDEAQSFCQRVLSVSQHSVRAVNLNGLIAMKQNDFGKARLHFERAIQIDPGFADPYMHLGTIKWHNDEREEALGLIEKGFILAPRNEDFSTTYHSAVCSVKQYSRAEIVFREALGLFPGNKQLTFLFIDILLQQEKHAEALNEIQRAMNTFGIDDGIIEAGLEIRSKSGPLSIGEDRQGHGSLSVCIIAKNEEKYIVRSLVSILPLADEIVVVDTGSTDRTKAIATIFGARVYDIEWKNDFSEARNFSLQKATGDWILVHDADEAISPVDYDTIRKLIDAGSGNNHAYLFTTRTYSNNPNLEGWTPNRGEYPNEEESRGWCGTTKTRLFPHDDRIRFQNEVHELVEHSLSQIGFQVKACSVPIHHYGKLDEERTRSRASMYFELGKNKLASFQDTTALRELAIQAGELKHFKEAIDLWGIYIGHKPDDYFAHFHMSTLYLEIEEFDKALACAKIAKQLNPRSRDSLLGFATSSIICGSMSEAIETLENLTETDPQFITAKGVLAAAYAVEKDGRGYAMIQELQTDHFDLTHSFYWLAKRLIRSGRQEYAKNLLETAVDGMQMYGKSMDLLQQLRVEIN